MQYTVDRSFDGSVFGTAPELASMRARFAIPVAVAGGATIALAGAPHQWSSIAFVGAALLLATVEPERGRVLRSGRAFVAGLVAGTACNAVAMYWVVHVLQAFGGFPLIAAVPTAALLWLAQGLAFAFALVATSALAWRGLPAWVVLPAALEVAVAWVPALFPWHPSISQMPWLPWVQLGEIGGEPLLDVLWALVGCGLVEAVRRRGARRLLPAAAGGLALVLPAAYGWARLPAVREARANATPMRVGVVQPNIGIRQKHDDSLRLEHLRRLRGTTRRLEQQGAELVVWPETAYPFRLRRARERDPAGPRSLLADGVEGPLLFGAVTYRGRCDRWNSAVAMRPGGRIAGVADKVHLLAFGEYVPLWSWLPPLQELFVCPGLKPGARPEAVRIHDTRIGVLNCYEDLLGAEARRLVPDDATLMVNMTNDAWFGDTSAPRLHHQLARMRAVELRRDLVRVVNTGVSGHVASTGATLERTPTFERTAFVAAARLQGGTTPWMRFGDCTTPLLAGALLGAALAVRRRPPHAGPQRNPAAR